MPQGNQAQGNGSLNPQGEGEGDGAGSNSGAPQYLTKDDVTKIVNQAISARSKSTTDKVAEQLAEFKTGIGALLEEKFASFAPAKQVGDGANAGDGGGNVADIANHPFVKGMAKQLSDLKATADAAKAETEKERVNNRNQTMRQAVSDMLLKGGIAPERVRHALGFLVDVDKRVFHNENGDVVFRDSDGSEMDLDTGLKSWAKTDDAKVYLAPRNVQGSGGAGGGRTSGTAGQKTVGLGRALLQSIPGMPTIGGNGNG